MTETGSQFLDELETIIQQRLAEGGEQSYTAQLVASGETRVAQKVGEEAVEVALAAVSGNRDELVEEAADLLYHLLVLLNSRNACLGDVSAVLASRHRD
jgi:phosphoribosyl-ATP pyrophosphohydrolase